MKYISATIFGVLLIIVFFLSIIIFKVPIEFIFTYGKLISRPAYLLFLINGSMFVIFTLIKKAKQKKLKLFFVKLSRSVFPYHIQIAIIGTSLILIHIIIMLINLPNLSMQEYGLKALSGILTVFLLAFTLIAGYYRYQRASNSRRRFHLIVALIFIFFTLLHALI